MLAKIEAVVGRKVMLSKGGGAEQKMACGVCTALLNQIQSLEQQLLNCKTDLASKYASANPVPSKQSRWHQTNHVINLFYCFLPGVQGNQDRHLKALDIVLAAYLQYRYVNLPRITLTRQTQRCRYSSWQMRETLRAEETQDWMFWLRKQNLKEVT